MEIFLVRHTRPAVPKGVCYGQSDLDVTETFYEEATIIRQHLPGRIQAVYSSPLKRCSKLARHLFPAHQIQLKDELKEINCGQWELKLWDEIPPDEIDPWMADFLNVPTKGGESYVDLHRRVSNIFDQVQQQQLPAVIVAHGGVLRSILSHITGIGLRESFKVFSLRYGCVVRLTRVGQDWQHEVLLNPFHEKEVHKPSRF